MAYPGIDRRGAPIFAKKYTLHKWHLFALEGSGCMLPQKIIKIRDLKWRILDHISAEIWPFFVCFWNPEQGGGGARADCAPSESTTEPWKLEDFYQSSSFCFIWIPMLWIYSYYIYFHSLNAGTVFIRQNPTSTVYSDVYWSSPHGEC